MKQLRFTTTRAYSTLLALFNPDQTEQNPLVIPDSIGEIVYSDIKGKGAYIHDDAEELAGFDIPMFLDGDMGQLDLSVKEQDILMMLPDNNYKCKAELQLDKAGDYNKYYITLK